MPKRRTKIAATHKRHTNNTDPPEPPEPLGLKVNLDPKTCRKAIAFVAGVIPHRTSLPVLSELHIIGNGETTIRATDLDLTIAVTLPICSTVPGQCLMPKGALIGALKSAKDSLIIQMGKKLMADIVADGFKQTVPCLSVDEFPPADDFKPESSVKLSASKFKEALKQVACAQSTDASRYVINSVLVECFPEEVILVATDGRRLHKTSLKRLDPDAAWVKRIKEAEQKYKETGDAMRADPSNKSKEKECEAAREHYNNCQSIQIVVPSGTVDHLLKLPLEKTDDLLVIEAKQEVPQQGKALAIIGKCAFHYGPFKLVSRQIDGNYPNYRQVIPAEFKESIKVHADELAKAVTHAATVCTEKCNSVRLNITRHLLTVSGESPDRGKASAQVAINYVGPDLVIAFDPKYLLSVCTAFKGGEVTIELIDELSPGVFKSGNTIVVIMPMRLS